MSNKPIIFLAFANDPAHPLPALADEARAIQDALKPAQEKGLCEIIPEPYATLDRVLAAFREHPDRVAIFHFAGHAGGDTLLLEAAGGQTTAANAGGLARFLAEQAGLALVFLNGCATREQAQGLLDAGVSVVIATSQKIKDKVAASFAAQFYTSLAKGVTLRRAFGEAEGAIQAATSGQSRELFAEAMIASAAGELPWALYKRPGAEDALSWNLPAAANDPLFGLPPLPLLDLPDKPYRYLDWYRREDAEVFFGRGHEIRQLYDRVTAADGAPIVLFYGQSGVGKSSLLAAGLLPRLEGSHEVRYARRDQAQGLAGTLAVALGTGPNAGLTMAWRRLEAQAGRPLLIILDQVEELFTRPNREQPNEMAVFLAAAAALFGDPGHRPAGKLILSFRKEWLAEIKERLAERSLPRTEVFLERLDREGIVEIVTGPRRTERLRAQFSLEIGDPLLPGQIADDLLADRESPVAPMLAILMADLWDAARARSYDQPVFDENLYQELRSRGLSLDDFLGRQLGLLHGKLPEVIDSGLALDLLAHHTTPLGTAEQRTLADLEQTYRHRLDVLPALLQECRDLYLLVDPSKNQPDQPRASRMTHDTLAPHVRKRFDESVAPGPQARRILESRATDWKEGKEGTLLDAVDLALVEAGAQGMRAQKPDEVRLVQASAVARIRHLEEQQQQARALKAQESKAATRLRLLLIILTGLALIAPGLWIRQQVLKQQARSPLVRIPASRYEIGSPATVIEVPEFRIERYEVSNQQYRLCVRARACGIPTDPVMYEDASLANHPVVYVTAYQADAYCRWLGRRLPINAEWDRAAFGADHKTWPWGSAALDPARVNMKFSFSDALGTSPVNSHPDGRTINPEGIFNLVGNVWEWTTTPTTGDPYGIDPEWKTPLVEWARGSLMTRGGSYLDYADNGTDWLTMVSSAVPRYAVEFLGFRCAENP